MNSELPNRDELEAYLAKQLARVSARHRAELERLLGNPPNAANVPAEFWERVHKEAQAELVAALALIFAASAEQSGLSPEDAQLVATAWAEQRGAEVAGGWVEHSARMLETADAAWQDQQQRAQREAQRAAAEESQRRRESGEPLQIEQDDQEPISFRVPRQEIRATTNRIFGPDRVEGVAITETTTARAQGAEIAVEATVGLSRDDLWITVGDGKVCEICSPLHRSSRDFWSRYFPAGPPTHPRCRCVIDYANASATEPAQ